MKILFFYESRDDAEPLIRSVKELKDEGIEMAFSKQIFSGFTYSPENKYDAILIHSTICSDVFLKQIKVPVFIRDKIDGAQLGFARRFINHEKVKAVIKGYNFKDREFNNYTLNRSFCSRTVPQEKVDVSKIKIGHGFGSYARLSKLKEKISEYSEKKEIDVCFYGSVYKYRVPKVKQHRKDAISAIESYPGTKKYSTSRSEPHNIYLKILQQSHSCVSPFGYGEVCYRDYEALAMGCSLIKPDMSNIDCYPNIFEGTYRPCKFDFSDLHGIIKENKQNKIKFDASYVIPDSKTIAKQYKEIFHGNI